MVLFYTYIYIRRRTRTRIGGHVRIYEKCISIKIPSLKDSLFFSPHFFFLYAFQQFVDELLYRDEKI